MLFVGTRKLSLPAIATCPQRFACDSRRALRRWPARFEFTKRSRARQAGLAEDGSLLIDGKVQIAGDLKVDGKIFSKELEVEKLTIASPQSYA